MVYTISKRESEGIMRIVLTMILGLVLLFPADRACAQKRKVPIAKRSVDLVTLRAGPTLYGSILGRAADGSITLAVERDWLKKTSSEFYEQQVDKESQESCTALVDLRDRIKKWIKQRSQKKRLVSFLQNELLRVEQKLAERENRKLPRANTQFLIVEIPAKQIRRGYVQPRQNRTLAMAAWRERLSHVESKAASDLLQELRERGIDVSKQQFDLTARFPRRPETEQHWAARKAVVEHHFGNSLEFQGTGNFLLQTGGDAKLSGIEGLLAGMLQQQLEKGLADLLGTPAGEKDHPNTGLSTATRTADEKQVPAVMVTRLEHRLQTQHVSVEKLFLAKMPDGTWEIVWKHVETVDASKRRPDTEKGIAENRQVKQILDAVKTLGLDSGDNRIQTAIRFGAATMQAQQTAGEKFFEFEKRYVRRLDGPPLIFPGSR